MLADIYISKFTLVGRVNNQEDRLAGAVELHPSAKLRAPSGGFGWLRAASGWKVDTYDKRHTDG